MLRSCHFAQAAFSKQPAPSQNSWGCDSQASNEAYDDEELKPIHHLVLCLAARFKRHSVDLLHFQRTKSVSVTALPHQTPLRIIIESWRRHYNTIRPTHHCDITRLHWRFYNGRLRNTYQLRRPPKR
jgi:hypothetical protein